MIRAIVFLFVITLAGVTARATESAPGAENVQPNAESVNLEVTSTTVTGPGTANVQPNVDSASQEVKSTTVTGPGTENVQPNAESVNLEVTSTTVTGPGTANVQPNVDSVNLEVASTTVTGPGTANVQPNVDSASQEVKSTTVTGPGTENVQPNAESVNLEVASTTVTGPGTANVQPNVDSASQEVKSTTVTGPGTENVQPNADSASQEVNPATTTAIVQNPGSKNQEPTIERVETLKPIQPTVAGCKDPTAKCVDSRYCGSVPQIILPFVDQSAIDTLKSHERCGNLSPGEILKVCCKDVITEPRYIPCKDSTKRCIPERQCTSSEPITPGHERTLGGLHSRVFCGNLAAGEVVHVCCT